MPASGWKQPGNGLPSLNRKISVVMTGLGLIWHGKKTTGDFCSQKSLVSLLRPPCLSAAAVHHYILISLGKSPLTGRVVILYPIFPFPKKTYGLLVSQPFYLVI